MGKSTPYHSEVAASQYVRCTFDMLIYKDSKINAWVYHSSIIHPCIYFKPLYISYSDSLYHIIQLFPLQM